MEVHEEVSSPLKDVVDRPVEHPPEHHLPRRIITPPHVGERMTQENRDPRPYVGTPVANIPVGGCQGTDSVVESAGQQSGTPIESSPSAQASVNAQHKTVSPTTGILPLHCRICETPPMITTRPTVTTCGHLFCSEYVPSILLVSGNPESYSSSGA